MKKAKALILSIIRYHIIPKGSLSVSLCVAYLIYLDNKKLNQFNVVFITNTGTFIYWKKICVVFQLNPGTLTACHHITEILLSTKPIHKQPPTLTTTACSLITNAIMAGNIIDIGKTPASVSIYTNVMAIHFIDMNSCRHAKEKKKVTDIYLCDWFHLQLLIKH